MSNDSVTPSRILAPHIAATGERAQEAGTVVVIHDTSEFEFSGEQHRTGLGRLSELRQGFYAHVALAARMSDGCPLGVVDLHTWTRAHPPGKEKRQTYRHKTRVAKESDRWAEGAARVEGLLRGRARAIHVMDREADFYRLEAELVETGAEFVIRGSHLERRLADGRTLGESESTPTEGRRASGRLGPADRADRKVAVAPLFAGHRGRGAAARPRRDGACRGARADARTRGTGDQATGSRMGTAKGSSAMGTPAWMRSQYVPAGNSTFAPANNPDRG